MEWGDAVTGWSVVPRRIVEDVFPNGRQVFHELDCLPCNADVWCVIGAGRNWTNQRFPDKASAEKLAVKLNAEEDGSRYLEVWRDPSDKEGGPKYLRVPNDLVPYVEQEVVSPSCRARTGACAYWTSDPAARAPNAAVAWGSVTYSWAYEDSDGDDDSDGLSIR